MSANTLAFVDSLIHPLGDYAARLRPALPPSYHDIADVLARFLGAECVSVERGGCRWFTRFGPEINNHRCKGCKSTFCDVHHTTDMCPKCTGISYCLVCLGKFSCYVPACTRTVVDSVHGHHVHFGECVVRPDLEIARRSHTYVYNTGSKFACAEHAFKRTYDKMNNLIVHNHDCTDPDNDPVARQAPYRTHDYACVLQ